MKKDLFVINGNTITVFPNEAWKKAGYLLLIVFPCLCLVFFVSVNLPGIRPLVIMLITIVVAVFPFFFIGSRRVVIDGNTQTVFYTSWLGTGKTFPFSDIQDVTLVNQLSYGTTSGGYYRLILKKNHYGKGIQLNMGYKKSAAPFIYFEQTAIPFIRKLLAANKKEAESNYGQNAFETEAAGFTMFKQKDGRFISKPIKTINLIIAILMAGLGVYVMYSMVSNHQFKKEYYWVFAFMATIVNVGLWGERIEINPVNKTIERSYLGLLKKRYSYNHIIGFHTLRHVTGFGNNGIDIRVEIKNASTIQQITLFSRVSSKKAQVLMEEVKRIFAA